jgi:tetratricopeptide (TPR) repeat protein
MNFLRILGMSIALFGCVNMVIAQDKPAEKIKVSADEEKSIKKIEAGKDFASKMKAATDFVKKFPKSAARFQVVDYMASEVFASKDNNQSIANAQQFFALFTEQSEMDKIIPNLIFSHLNLKMLDEAFSVGEKYISRNTSDIAIRLQLAIEGSNLLRSKDRTYIKQTLSFSNEAIALIEANKKPVSITDDVWKEYQTKWLPQLYLTVGIVKISQRNRAEALSALQKTVSLDPKEINAWLLLGTTYDEEYQEIAQDYVIAEGKEKDETLKKAQTKLDIVIDHFARVVALTDGDATYQGLNSQVRENLEVYYKFRNKGSLVGMKELIEKYKSLKTDK